MNRALAALVVVACSSRGDGEQASRARGATPSAPRDAASEPRDAGPTLDDALTALRTRDLAASADHIRRRVEQQSPKMRLSSDDAQATALALLEVAGRAPIRELHAVMPRSTVELARATHERGVTLDEADAIATYLVAVVAACRFERLGVFDENHSHVIGREWSEIDYTGESMTWQTQRDAWVPRGVVSFERAAFIHAYFIGAEKLPHWDKVYKPRGKLAQLTVTPSK